MKFKTAELEGDALDYMVWCVERGQQPLVSVATWAAENDDGFHPSRNWEQGGPIIEREQIGLTAGDSPVRWEAFHPQRVEGTCGVGHTLLIAVMRAYVASKLGDEVEIPD